MPYKSLGVTIGSMEMPQLSTPGQLDMEVLAKKFEQRIATLTTQNIMLEAQLEAMAGDREKLVDYIKSIESEKAANVPTKKAS